MLTCIDIILGDHVQKTQQLQSHSSILTDMLLYQIKDLKNTSDILTGCLAGGTVQSNGTVANKVQYRQWNPYSLSEVCDVDTN